MKEILHYSVIVYKDHTIKLQLKDGDGITWYSKRYNKKITVPYGEESDGATKAITRLGSRSHWVHDKICKRPYWNDGTPITAWQAATVLFDIHREESKTKWYYNRRFSAILGEISAYTWTIMTFLFGCKKARLNGWF